MRIDEILNCCENRDLDDLPTQLLESMYDRLKSEIEALNIAVRKRMDMGLPIHKATIYDIRRYEKSQNAMARALLIRVETRPAPPAPDGSTPKSFVSLFQNLYAK